MSTRSRPDDHRHLLALLLLACILSPPLAGCRGCGCSEGEPAPPASPPAGREVPQQPLPGRGDRRASALPTAGFVEEFAAPGPPDPARWAVTSHNDFQESAVDVVADPRQPGDSRLRLMAATLGTDDDTVKQLGVALRQLIDLRQPATITVDLDWAHQANGSYLTQEITLCPTWTTENPLDAPDWLAFRFVGVPPGNTARPEVMRSGAGNLQVVERFGWPEVKPGRELGLARVTLELEGRALRLLVDGEQLAVVADAGFRFDQAHLYLQLSTHSNYTRRELFFDRVEVRGSLLPAQVAP